MRSVLMCVLLAGAACAKAGVDGQQVYRTYRGFLDDSSVSDTLRMQKAQEYLRSLSREEFLEFIRELVRQTGFDDRKATLETVSPMAMFAKTYVAGPGSKESLLDSLDQLDDPTLPSAWKWGLLSVLRPEKRPDLSDAELGKVVGALRGLAQGRDTSDEFRVVFLTELYSFLRNQWELLLERTPQLQDAMSREDSDALQVAAQSGAASERAKRALTLLNYIREYRALLQQAADQAKDEKNRDQLTNLLNESNQPGMKATRQDFDRMLEEAKAAWAREDYPPARRLAREVLKHPRATEEQKRRAQLIIDRVAEAIAALDTSQPGAPTTSQAAAPPASQPSSAPTGQQP